MSVPASMSALQSANVVHFSPSRVTPLISLAWAMPSSPATSAARAAMIDGVVGLGGVVEVLEVRVDLAEPGDELVGEHAERRGALEAGEVAVGDVARGLAALGVAAAGRRRVGCRLRSPRCRRRSSPVPSVPSVAVVPRCRLRWSRCRPWPRSPWSLRCRCCGGIVVVAAAGGGDERETERPAHRRVVHVSLHVGVLPLRFERDRIALLYEVRTGYVRYVQPTSITRERYVSAHDRHRHRSSP